MDAHLLHGRVGGALRACILAVVGAVATASADAPPSTSFQPGDISIGEPIPLSIGGPAAGSPAPSPSAPTPRRADVTDVEAVPGNGWLGLAVDESTVPGRWRVEDVTPDGPAARAGIAVGDELRAVNGVPLASREEVSQALTTIAIGQDVRVAVARADQVTDKVLRAAPRPTARAAEPPRVAAPADPAQAVAPPPAAPQWQASPSREPVADASRFSRFANPTPAAAPTPANPPMSATPPMMPAAPSMPAAELPSPFMQPPAALPSAASTPLPATPGAAVRTALGVRTVPIDPTTQARFNLPEATGAYVIGVVQDLPAAKAGVPPGSVIVALGDQPVRSPVELTRLVSSGPLDRPVTVQFVLPGGEAKRTAVRLQALDPPLARALTDDGPTPGPAPALLQPGHSVRRAERPTGDEPALRSEIRALRGRLERLERLLDPRSRRDD